MIALLTTYLCNFRIIVNITFGQIHIINLNKICSLGHSIAPGSSVFRINKPINFDKIKYGYLILVNTC